MGEDGGERDLTAFPEGTGQGLWSGAPQPGRRSGEGTGPPLAPGDTGDSSAPGILTAEGAVRTVAAG